MTWSVYQTPPGFSDSQDAGTQKCNGAEPWDAAAAETRRMLTQRLEENHPKLDTAHCHCFFCFVLGFAFLTQDLTA
jgi:hypothetical protein